MSQRLSYNSNYIQWSYAGSDGQFLPLAVTAESEPLTMQPPVVLQTAKTEILGAIQSGPTPLPKGKLTLLNIPSNAITSSPHARIVNGANNFQGTNGTITRSVDYNLRLVTLRKTVNLKNIQGQSYYIDYTGTEMRFPESVTENDTGNTVEVEITVHGTVGAAVYLSSP